MKNDTKLDESRIGPPTDMNPRTDPPLDFPDRDYGELSPVDYRTLGFLSGLEIHQQLKTRSKLFCRCAAGRFVTHHDAEVLRHMRPTLSELGEYDGTALMEFKTRKEIVYQLERNTVCTYEIDDTPPFGIDGEAIRIAVEIAQLLNLNLVSEIHVMRKQYLDGSIPTGFQRTAMLGLGGVIPFIVPELGLDRELRIRQLSLEEDSCREVSDVGHRVTFLTDRLGTPLAETVTEPDFLTPLELQAGARLLAHVAQTTGKVRRGPGAARQDVNVSVAGGRRVEIKGVDHHRGLPRLVHVEAFRQLNLLRLRAELLRRGVTPEVLSIPDAGLPWEVSPNAVDVGASLKHGGHRGIHGALAGGETVAAVRLPGFGGLLARSTQPGVTFAHEFMDRVRVIACLEHQPFMIHSDLRESGLNPGEWRQLRTLLKAEKGDALVVVWGPEQDAATAVREVLLRACEALAGVPSETRQAFGDGTTGFERILPGPDRMYPDTDTPPLPIPDAMVIEIRERLPEPPWARGARYERLGLDPRVAWRLAQAPWADVFDGLDPVGGDLARRLAATLEQRIPHHRRRKGLQSAPEPERLKPMVRAMASGEIRLEAMDRIFDALLERPLTPADEVLAPFRCRPDDSEEFEQKLGEVAGRVAPLARKPPDVVRRWAMGELMPSFLGRLEPAHVEARLAETLREKLPRDDT